MDKTKTFLVEETKKIEDLRQLDRRRRWSWVSLSLSERVETVVGQACESLIAHFSCSLLLRAAPPRTKPARRGCSVTQRND